MQDSDKRGPTYALPYFLSYTQYNVTMSDVHIKRGGVLILLSDPWVLALGRLPEVCPNRRKQDWS